ncbi:MAG: primosomal protein N' [Bacteroidota bacterium]
MREDFAQTLIDALEEVLERQEQAIIFQNRRGYAPYITCEDCAWVPMCTQCAVSLTYHQQSNHLRCHYCGYYTPMPPACGVCDSHRLKNVSFGTEKLEETLQLFFPKKTVQRMDLDTTRGKHSYDRLIEGLEQGQIDILVGTQMVTKGLDFGRVSLVGVLGVDKLLHFPDFRAGERCFQLVTQVSGRAGRRQQPGRVIIQTANPKNPVLEAVVQYDYMHMYERELAERREFRYPPFMRLIRIILKHRDQVLVTAAAKALAQQLREKLGRQVLGPQTPLVSRIRQQYLMELWIKVSRDMTKANNTKAQLRTASRQLLLDRSFKAVKVVFDVDPM